MANKTALQVVQDFMQALTKHKYTSSTKNLGTAMLDDAVKASTSFSGIQNALDNFKSDQIEAERIAVEEVLGSGYAGMLMSQVNGNILKADIKGYPGAELTNCPSSRTTTVRRVILERKAYNFLEKYCGIILNHEFYFYTDKDVSRISSSNGNVDTGAITGSDANITVTAGEIVYGTTIDSTQTIGTGAKKTDESVVPEDTTAKFDGETEFTVNGATFKLLGVCSDSSGSPAKATKMTLDELTDDQRTIFKGISKWWAKECTKLVKESYGIDFKSETASATTIKIFFYSNANSSTLATAYYNYSTSDGVASNLHVNINMAKYTDISEDDVDGKSTSTSFLLDRTLSHELTHSIMESNIRFFYALPQFIKEGSAELTHGIDDERGHNIFKLASGVLNPMNYLKLNDNGTGKVEAYAGGYMFMRYLAKQGALQSLANYGGADSAGGTWTLKGTTATYTVNGTVVATVKGLRANLAATGDQIDGITVDGSTITLSQKVLGTTNVTLGKNDNFTLALRSDMSGKQVTNSNAAWTVKNGTATLKADTSAGYFASGDGKTIFYAKATTGKTLATISGLSRDTTDVTAETVAAAVSDNKITLTDKLIGTSKKVTLKSDTYTFATPTGVAIAADIADPYWTVKGTTATYQTGVSAGYTLTNSKTLAYSNAKATTIATVSGLKAGLTPSSGKIDGITADGTTITLSSANVLGTTAVKLNSKTFTKIDITADTALASQKNQNILAVNGTKAIYKNVDTGYFTRKDDKTYNYVKEKVNATYATVNGIRKDADKSTITVDPAAKTITLAADALPTSPNNNSKITLGAKDDFSLVIADALKVAYGAKTWSYDKNKATYTAPVTTAGYSVASNAKTLTYIAAADKKGNTISTTFATVNNVKSAEGIEVDGSVITVGATALNQKRVTLGAKDEFTLNINDDDDDKPKETSEKVWTNNGTAKLTAQMSTGYTLSADARSINYTNKAWTKIFAQIAGTNKKSDADTFAAGTNGTVVTLAAEQLGNKATISGEYSFVFANDYTGKTINGSNLADTVTVNGTGNTIQTAAGDDVINLGAGSNTVNAGRGNDTITNSGDNVFVYANGDGNDTIANFTAGSKIKLASVGNKNRFKSATLDVTDNGTDIIVTVNKGATNSGTITLTGATGTSFDIVANNNEVIYGATASSFVADETISELLYSDNFATDDLSELTGGSNVNDFSVGNVETSTATDLTNDAPIITATEKK